MNSIVKDIYVKSCLFSDVIKMHEYLADPLKTKDANNIQGLGFITNEYIDEIYAVKAANQQMNTTMFRQITISISPASNTCSDKEYMEIGRDIASYYYAQGYQVIWYLHKDTKRNHFHLLLNSVNYITGKIFKQSLKGMNRLKVHCNHIFHNHQLDLIQMPVEKMIDITPHDLSEGFEIFEIFDEIMADQASELAQLCNEPVTEHKPLFTPEYAMGDCVICAPTQTRSYFNPDAPTPWCRLAIYPDGSWGLPTYPMDDYTSLLISYMRPEDQSWIKSFAPQRYTSNRRQVSSKDFLSNPFEYVQPVPNNNYQRFFLDCHIEYIVTLESEDDIRRIVSVLNSFAPISRTERAYNTKLGVAAVAQLNELGVNAEIKTDNSTQIKIIVKGDKDDTSGTQDVIEIPCEED